MTPITPEPLTRDAFAPFGDVIEQRSDRGRWINDGTCLKFAGLAGLDLDKEGGTPAMHIYRASPLPAPITITRLERHNLGSQAFMPLDGRPFLIVVAPPGEPEVRKIRVFRAGGDQGVNYRPGTWHHFCLALEQVSHFLVIDRDAPDADCDEFVLPLGSQLVVAP